MYKRKSGIFVISLTLVEAGFAICCEKIEAGPHFLCEHRRRIYICVYALPEYKYLLLLAFSGYSVLSYESYRNGHRKPKRRSARRTAKAFSVRTDLLEEVTMRWMRIGNASNSWRKWIELII